MREFPAGPRSANVWRRIFAFDEAALQQVHRDTTATIRGVLTVLAVMAISSLGGFIWWAVLEDAPGKLDFFIESVVVGTLAATGLFFVWAGLVAAAGGQLGRRDNAALAATIRTLSFSSLPFAVSFLIFIPGLEFPISLAAVSLLLLSTTLATRTALGVNTARAVGANLIGFLLWLIILSALIERGDYFAPAVFIWGISP